jgi:transposase
VKLAHPAQQIAFQEYLHAVTEAGARIVRHEQALRDALSGWTLAPVVLALQALRGVQLIAAMTLVAEIQDFWRFASPRQLMAYLGLVPCEDSSGPRRRQGVITKAGNAPARRMLVEIAHQYRTRLCSRFRRMLQVACGSEGSGVTWRAMSQRSRRSSSPIAPI